VKLILRANFLETKFYTHLNENFPEGYKPFVGSAEFGIIKFGHFKCTACFLASPVFLEIIPIKITNIYTIYNIYI